MSNQLCSKVDEHDNSFSLTIYSAKRSLESAHETIIHYLTGICDIILVSQFLQKDMANLIKQA